MAGQGHLNEWVECELCDYFVQSVVATMHLFAATTQVFVRDVRVVHVANKLS